MDLPYIMDAYSICMKYVYLFLLLLANAFAFSQVQPINIAPSVTDVGYSTNDPDHYLVYNPGTQNNTLVLWLGGTSSNPAVYWRICRFAGELGFHVISLSYPNDVAAAPLGNDPDSTVFERYRQEICFGTSLSNAVAVDTFNSIYTRTIKLMQYLDSNRPAENWGQFMAGADSLDWSKVIVGGHSQGSGHAPYLAKVFPVERCLMFAGPNDYNTFYNRGAPWFAVPGATGPNAHYAYLHQQDNVADFSHQIANLGRLGLFDSTLVDPLTTPYGSAHLLYTNQPAPPLIGFHSTPITETTINDGVWEYMFTTPVPVGRAEPHVLELEVYPNPARDQVRIKSAHSIGELKIWDMQGKVVRRVTSRGSQVLVDLDGLPPGTYLIQVDRATQKFMLH